MPATGNMAKSQTIKQLYVPALAEGEGVGTAYEYYAKRLVLLPWLARGEQPQTMLVAGLPEKYGSSLDFLLLGSEMGCQVTVIDERQEALIKLSRTLEMLQNASFSPQLRPSLVQTGNLTTLSELAHDFDLVVSSEVLQRLTSQQRIMYVERLQDLAPRVALFAPNAGNESHVGLSGLAGLHLQELDDLIGRNSPESFQIGFIDTPPFPPGITRSEAQREEASTGSMEAFAMWGLGYYARLEKFIPAAVRRKRAHIVYGLLERHQR